MLTSFVPLSVCAMFVVVAVRLNWMGFWRIAAFTVGGIFGLFGIFMFLSHLILFIRYRRIERRGALAVGKYITAATSVKIRGVPFYFVKFTFEDAQGQQLTAKSDSRFSFYDVQCYAVMESFRIKYLGKYADINEAPRPILTGMLVSNAPHNMFKSSEEPQQLKPLDPSIK